MTLSNLVNLTETNNQDEIIELLQQRLKADQPYTQLGNHRLIVVNPYKPLELLNDATLEAYGQHGYKDISRKELSHMPEPHVYEMATRVYLLMRRRAENQTIVLSGIYGSGKSTTHQHILKELLYLSTHTRKEEKLKNQIQGANMIFQSFGGTAASSSLGQFQTLQFNERGRVIGSSNFIYLLDKHRISSRNKQQYQIFYQLLAGTTPDEKQALHITHANFNYLKHTNQRNTQQDLMGFNDIKAALKLCGFKTKTVAQMCQLLTAILHLGNVQFVDGNKHHFGTGNLELSTSTTTPTSHESCRIKNKEILALVAAALGVATSKLETTLTHKSKLIGNEFCTAFLTTDTASQQRDSLAQTIYTVLVLWISHALNQKLSTDGSLAVRTISVLDTVGFQLSSRTAGTFHDVCINYAGEKLRHYLLDQTFNLESPQNQERRQDHTWSPSPVQIPYAPLSTFYHGSNNNTFALFPLINRESKRLASYAIDATDSHLLSVLFQKKKNANNNVANDYRVLSTPSTPSHSFAIQHYDAFNMDYSVDGFLESNVDEISPDFIHLFKHSCTNAFVHDLFDTETSLADWHTEIHSRDEKTVIRAQLPVWSIPTENDEKKTIQSVLDQVVSGVKNLESILASTRITEIIHIAPNDSQKPDQFDAIYVGYQLQLFKVSALATFAAHMDIMYPYSQHDFMVQYRPLTEIHEEDEDAKERLQAWIKTMQWTSKQVCFGQEKVWISFETWRVLENQVRAMEKEARLREKERIAAIAAEKEAARLAAIAAALEAEEYEAALKQEAEAEAAAQAAELAAIAADRWSNDKNPFDDDCRSDFSNEDDRTESDAHFEHSGKRSDWGEEDDTKGLSEGFGPNLDMSKMMEDYSVQPEEQIEEVSLTGIRRWWSRFVFLMTWWIPSFALKYIGKMSREDVQMAWREKVTLCILIFSFSGFIIFFIVGLGQVICSGTKDLYSAENVANHQVMSDYWVSVRGKVYDVTSFVATDHGTPVYTAGKSNMDALAGRDLSYTFPPPLSIACAGLVTDPAVTVTPNETIVLGPFVHFSGPQQAERTLEKLRDPYWLNKYFGPTMNIYKKGDLVVTTKTIKDDYSSWGRLILSIDEKVYDLTDYMATARRYPAAGAGVPNYHYLDSSVETLFTKFGGKDATAEWNKYSAAMDEPTRIRNKACLDNAFFIGRVDYRDSIRCTFVNYLLLSFAVMMSVVILVKFLAALQFGSAPTPEDHDKFVICQVPCYTEDEESLKKTIDSIAAMTYDDKHKLLFLIADGMIIGGGNDRPTPRILLDILGHNEDDDPEGLMFKSIGEGSKQLNYGKVYSGVYQHEGHVVPYIVVVKVGKPSERTKPGNRGKRDSQIICMNFLNKVHFDSEMSPLELEIYYHIKHIIGIDPGFYEYILMVDSDTEVYPDALNRLISCMLHDSRIIGICGETELGNEDRSWTTMIQVYEYYISHHLVKSFESLFGSVTCLPGCFCMYRIRTASKHQPLIVSPNVIHAYSDNQVDTLHKKNLLHLGEDRYLTTLMMKTFPQYKMVFTPYAKCRTVAPDQWRVLLSQRRRWINSTIHNLLELILLQELCGFCCLSMRFVVMTDLIGTITLPSSVIYLVYLLYEVISGTGPVPKIALGMLAGAYGLQSLIFIFKRQWQHIGWMIIYILAIPIFSFFIPLYAFWHFDDFSWGNTRVVVGDKTKQIIVIDDEKFDEKMIPLKKWSVHEQEMWETKTLRSEVQSISNRSDAYSYAESQAKSFTSSHHRGRHHYEQPYDTRTLRSHSSIAPSHVHSNHTSKYQLPPLLTGFSDEDTMGGQFSVDLSSVLNTKSEKSNKPANLGSGTRMVLLPEDDEIEREIERILLTSNLMTLTKKQVRSQLSTKFGVDLTIKKGFINATIERLLEQDL